MQVQVLLRSWDLGAYALRLGDLRIYNAFQDIGGLVYNFDDLIQFSRSLGVDVFFRGIQQCLIQRHSRATAQRPRFTNHLGEGPYAQLQSCYS